MAAAHNASSDAKRHNARRARAPDYCTGWKAPVSGLVATCGGLKLINQEDSTMKYSDILEVSLIVIVVITFLWGLLALISYEWLTMALCWTTGIAALFGIAYLEGEL